MPKSKKSESTKSEKLKDVAKSKPAKGAKSKPTPVAPEQKKSASKSPSKEIKKKLQAAELRAKAVKSTNPAPPKAKAIVVTTEEISLRAYFIAERREAMGWPGDSDTDWIEAEKQVRAEKSAL